VPGFVDQAPALQQLAAQQMVPDLARDLLLQGCRGDRVAGLMLGLLIPVNRAGVVVEAGIAENKAFLEFGNDVGVKPKWDNRVLLRRKLHVIEAAKHGRILVLPAAGDVQHQALGLKCHLRDLMAIPLIGSKLVETTDDGR
jgi:hypothetical protein